MTLEHPPTGGRRRGAAGEGRFLRWQGSGYPSNDRDDPAQPDELDSGADEQCRFEVFRADERRMTTTLFAGGDWHWRLVTTGGLVLAEASGYPNEPACRIAVAALQRRAAGAPIVSRESELP